MKRKVIAIMMVIIMCVSLNASIWAASMSDLQNQKNEASSSMKDAKDQLKDVKDEKTEALSEIEELNEQIAQSQEELDKLNAEVKQLEASIKQAETDLAEAEQRQEEQQKALEDRIVAKYTSGSISYWDILLNPESPLKFLSTLFMLEKVVEYDNQLIESIEQEKQTIETKKTQLDEEKAKVKTAKANAEKENVKLKNAKTTKNSKVAQLSAEEKELQDKIDEYQKEMDQAEAEMRRIAAEAAANKNPGAVFNGQLTFPCPGYSRISSYFGVRSSPGGGVGSRNHKGLDLAGSHGIPIVAADSGTVIKVSNTCSHDYPKKVSNKCSCGSGYGNYLMIDHGNGLVTLYGHCATINVSNGQKVSAGQKIATVGSTGYSTGNHLHFGVLLNGTYVNPLPYIT